MSEYNIYNKRGEKIGEIREESSGGTLSTILGLILLVAVASICSRCSEVKSNMEAAEYRAQVNSADSAYVYKLQKNIYEVNEEIDLTYEQTWMAANYPDVSFSIDSKVTSDTGISSYDNSASALDNSYYCNQPYQWSRKYGDFLTLKLDEKYNRLTGTVYLEKSCVTNYLDSEKNYFYNHPEADVYPHKAEDSFGLCVVFVDDKVVYESPILRPYGTLSDKMSVDISGGSEISICIVGLAYLGSPIVSK